MKCFQNKKDNTAKGEFVSKSNNQEANTQFEEKRTFGAMHLGTYFNYFKVGGGILGGTLNFVIFILSQSLIVLADYWVSDW